MLGCSLSTAIYANSVDNKAQIDKQIDKECKGFERNIEIIKCMNKIKISHGLKPEVDVFGEWMVVSVVDPITDESNVIVKTEAEVDGDTASLILRCLRGKPDLIIQWPFTTELPGRGKPVEMRTRIDKNKPVTTSWRMAEKTRNSMFYSQDVINLVANLVPSQRFVAEQASSNGSEVAVFKTSELNTAILPFQAACKSQ